MRAGGADAIGGFFAPWNVQLSYATHWNDAISADKHPGMDGSINPYIDQPVTETDLGHRFTLSWLPIDLGLVRFGAEGFMGFATTKNPKLMDEVSTQRSDALKSGGGGLVAEGSFVFDFGMEVGLKIALGGKRTWADHVDLGAGGADQSLDMASFYFAPQLFVGGYGLRIGYRPEIVAPHYKEFGGMTDADHSDYRYGIGDIWQEANVSHMLVFELSGSILSKL